jgi:hypothetical protein
VTQLALLLALSLIGVVLSFGFGRLEVKRGPVSVTVKRAEGALERASVAVLRLGAMRGLALLAVPAVGLGAFALLGTGHSSVPVAGRAVFLVVALLAGVSRSAWGRGRPRPQLQPSPAAAPVPCARCSEPRPPSPSSVKGSEF